MFEVNASANEDVPDTAIFGIISSRDTALATRTLAIGKDLTLTLIDYETEPPVKLRLRLKGDPNFAQLYERNSIAISHPPKISKILIGDSRCRDRRGGFEAPG